MLSSREKIKQRRNSELMIESGGESHSSHEQMAYNSVKQLFNLYLPCPTFIWLEKTI